MEENSLVFVKPRNEERALEVVHYLDGKLGFAFSRTILRQIRGIPEQIMREHYRNIQGFSFYEATIEAFLRGTIFLTAYSGENIVSRVRTIIGPTDPVVAKRTAPESIRAIFANDSLEVARRERRYLNNVIHSSENVEEARREIDLWKDFL
jgi:nucleoside-diphosphate kinase